MGSEIVSITDVLQNKDLISRFDNSLMNWDAEKGYAVQIIKGNSFLEKAAKSQPNSLLAAISNVAAIGLSLNPARRQAYLIPRGVKINGSFVQKVFLEPSYMGLCDIATSSGSIMWVQAKIVYASDLYKDQGIDKAPIHESKTFGDKGVIVGVYCVAKTKDGDYLTSTMDMQKLRDISGRSQAKTGPWKTDFEEMSKKAVIRNAYKLWPKADRHRMDIAVNLSNENEGFEPLNNVSEPSIENYNLEQKGYFDQLIEQNDGSGMYLLKKNLCGSDSTSKGAGVWISLMHSFPKGSKGKYGDLVNSLISSGECVVNNYI